MRALDEHKALTLLQRTKREFQSEIKLVYEPQAESCRTCLTPGACCTDAHFVNVHITRLEAVAIKETLRRTPRLSEEQVRELYRQASRAVAKYNLRVRADEQASFRQTFACPLFMKDIGCTVHARAKPAPCIQHACYENWEDLPPESLQRATEHKIEQLNTRVYGAAWAWLPLPLWMTLTNPFEINAELTALIKVWQTRGAHHKQVNRRTLPVLRHVK